MHEEVLSPQQLKLLPLVKSFTDRFVLIGGTAVALQLGHRRSIDFDMATFDDLHPNSIRNKIGNQHTPETILIDETNEYTVVINQVKLTFLKFPFRFESASTFQDAIKLPDLLVLGSLKAYALGRRAKWKDYVDLYFIINKFSFSKLVLKAKEIFGREFNEKQFREQLVYFEDIDYSEKVDYMPGFEVDDEVIKFRLQEISLQK